GWADPPRGARLLDLGAGRGAVSIAAAEVMGPGCSIIAGDISLAMLARLEDLELAQLQPRLLDARALDLPDASQDVVLSGFALHILSDPARALSEVARVLTAEGSAAFSIPGPSNDGGWWASNGAIFDQYTTLVTRDQRRCPANRRQCACRSALRRGRGHCPANGRRLAHHVCAAQRHPSAGGRGQDRRCPPALAGCLSQRRWAGPRHIELGPARVCRSDRRRRGSPPTGGGRAGLRSKRRGLRGLPLRSSVGAPPPAILGKLRIG
ncbi:MAG: methyltransferase domain-containing protein, partial [Acidimicrobiales bacterium]|nr:methyltransferase domain-containing protein [Acidimicrobiales bacterium]